MSIIYKKLFGKLKENFQTSTVNAPIKVINNDDIVEVYIGNNFYAALLSGGKIYVWGNNNNIPYATINNLINIVSISCGNNHIVLLDNNGIVSVYGDNSFKQLNIVQNISSVVAISANDDYSLALLNNGSVVGWGYNNKGQINIPFSLINIINISAGNNHCLALNNNGMVIGWGDNTYGQINIPNGNYIAIAAGDSFSLLLKNDRTVILIGDNKNGQLTIPNGLTNIISIAAGSSHALALNNNNRIIAWGNNNNNQLNIAENLYNVVSISAGYNTSLAVDKFINTTSSQSITTTTTPTTTTSSTYSSSGNTTPTTTPTTTTPTTTPTTTTTTTTTPMATTTTTTTTPTTTPTTTTPTTIPTTTTTTTPMTTPKLTLPINTNLLLNPSFELFNITIPSTQQNGYANDLIAWSNGGTNNSGYKINSYYPSILYASGNSHAWISNQGYLTQIINANLIQGYYEISIKLLKQTLNSSTDFYDFFLIFGYYDVLYNLPIQLTYNRFIITTNDIIGDSYRIYHNQIDDSLNSKYMFIKIFNNHSIMIELDDCSLIYSPSVITPPPPLTTTSTMSSTTTSTMSSTTTTTPAPRNLLPIMTNLLINPNFELFNKVIPSTANSGLDTDTIGWVANTMGVCYWRRNSFHKVINAEGSFHMMINAGNNQIEQITKYNIYPGIYIFYINVIRIEPTETYPLRIILFAKSNTNIIILRTISINIQNPMEFAPNTRSITTTLSTEYPSSYNLGIRIINPSPLKNYTYS
jgi:alpha-tubulin suppressor-like RCC1 family protein